MSVNTALPNEVTRPTFPWHERGIVSYGVPFPELATAHIQRLGKTRVFALVSESLARNTKHLDRLQASLGGKLAGPNVGFKSHTPWDDVLKLAEEV
jgi:hypothetical protein